MAFVSVITTGKITLKNKKVWENEGKDKIKKETEFIQCPD
jgi:hypothetical protein